MKGFLVSYLPFIHNKVKSVWYEEVKVKSVRYETVKNSHFHY